jgi:peptide/nickel transport system ATP-binding protein
MLRSAGDGEWVACHLESLPEVPGPLGDPRVRRN